MAINIDQIVKNFRRSITFSYTILSIGPYVWDTLKKKMNLIHDKNVIAANKKSNL